MRLRLTICLLAVGTFFSVQAFAHVAVFPRQSQTGAHHVAFSVRAPVEKDVPVVSLKVEIPSEWKAAGGQVDRVEYNPDWQVRIERDSDNWIETITWHGNEAPDYSYIEFGMIITLPELVGLQQIKAWQTYADGTVTAFIEDRNQEGMVTPAAGLMLQEAGAGGGGLSFSQGFSGLLGGLLGAGLVLIVLRNGKKKDES